MISFAISMYIARPEMISQWMIIRVSGLGPTRSLIETFQCDAAYAILLFFFISLIYVTVSNGFIAILSVYGGRILRCRRNAGVTWLGGWERGAWIFRLTTFDLHPSLRNQRFRHRRSVVIPVSYFASSLSFSFEFTSLLFSWLFCAYFVAKPTSSIGVGSLS